MRVQVRARPAHVQASLHVQGSLPYESFGPRCPDYILAQASLRVVERADVVVVMLDATDRDVLAHQVP
jgi:hypothetical protein